MFSLDREMVVGIKHIKTMWCWKDSIDYCSTFSRSNSHSWRTFLVCNTGIFWIHFNFRPNFTSLLWVLRMEVVSVSEVVNFDKILRFDLRTVIKLKKFPILKFVPRNSILFKTQIKKTLERTLSVVTP